MRVTVQVLPLLILLLTLPYSLVHQFSVIEVLLLIVGLSVLRTALVLYGLGGRAKDKRVILETISVSHYVEKVRWCMDYLDLDYIEEENVGILGIFLLGRSVPQLKIPGRGTGVTIGNSSDILRYLYGEHCLDDRLAPFLKPSELSLSLEKKFDQLGEDYRRFCYYTIFSNLSSSEDMQERNMQVWGLYQPNIPQWQKYLLKPLAPIFVKLLENRLKVTAEESKKSMDNANKILEEVESLLSDGRKFLLNTSQPTYIDFHFCSMVAIMTNPKDYGGQIFKHNGMPKPIEMPEAFNKEVKYIEERVVGKFVQNMYETFRLKTVQKLD